MRHGHTVMRPAVDGDLAFIGERAVLSALPDGWEHPRDNGFAWVMDVDGAPAAAFGVVIWPGNDAWLWAVFTPEAAPWMHRVQRAARHILPEMAKEFRRMQAAVDIDNPVAMRWALALGFVPTGDVVSGYEYVEWRS